MRAFASRLCLLPLLAAGSVFSQAQPPVPAGWPVAAQCRIAADAALYAPPDFKRQLSKHADRLMAGVKDAAAAEAGRRDAAAHRAAAARGARHITSMIRDRRPFADVAYEAGGIAHELASAMPYAADAPRSATFRGYPADPFRDPESLAAAALPSGSAAEAYDAAVTLTTRLLAWIWKASGGDARIVTEFPEAKGPYLVR